MSELRLDDVTVRYGGTGRGLTAVDGVSLTIPDGAIVGLVGESGSGKSTLARAAVGLLPLSRGRILLDGEPVSHRGRRRPLQMVFQDPYSSLDPRMTIGDSVAEVIPPGLGRADRRREVSRLLELVHLDPARAGAYPSELSGGQRQRVALARALAGRPEVVIADEITSALDVSIQGAVLNLVRKLQRELGLSMLFISHNLAVVRYVANHVAVMYLGRIVEHGPTADVLADPQHPYTRQLLAAMPGARLGQGADDKPGDRAGASDPVQVGAETPDALQPGESGLFVEPADPNHPPAGCRFHPSCPVGPLVHTDRKICRTAEPSAEHRNHAACHFALPAVPQESVATGHPGDPDSFSPHRSTP